MLIHLLILGISLGFSTAYNVDMAGWYEIAAGYIADAQVGICVQAIIGGCLLVLMSVLMAQAGAYSLMLLFSRLVLEISLLGVSLLSFGGLYFSWVLLKNVWFDMGVAALVPFLGVATAGFCLHLFDFNYPVSQKIVGYLVVSFFSIVFVTLRVM